MKMVEKPSIPRGSEKVCALTGESPVFPCPRKVAVARSTYLGTFKASWGAVADCWFDVGTLYGNFGSGNLNEQGIEYVVHYVTKYGVLPFGGKDTDWRHTAFERAYKLGVFPVENETLRAVLDDTYYPIEE